MANRIKGITVEIGGDTTKLSKALESVNKNIKNTQSQLKDVENTENRTTITISAVLHKLTLQPNQKILNKNEKITLKLYRARYPRRMKSKGQAVFEEKECPRCGANFMPDKNGCCSYCGYQLSIDNSKWRIDYE